MNKFGKVNAVEKNKKTSISPSSRWQIILKTLLPVAAFDAGLLLTGIAVYRITTFESITQNLEDIIFFVILIAMIGLFTYLLLLGTYTLITNPQKAQEKFLASAPYRLKYRKVFQQFFGADIKTLKILKRNPSFLAVYLFVLVVVAPFLFLFSMSAALLLLNVDGPHPSFPVYVFIWVPAIYFAMGFAFANTAALSILVIGEILQARIIPGKRFSLSELIKDYILAIPPILLLSATFILFMFAGRKEGESRIGASVRGFSIFVIFETVLYYVYANLAMIALENRPLTYSLKEAFKFLKEEAGELFKISVSSGATIAILFLVLAIAVLGIWGPDSRVTAALAPVLGILLFGTLVMSFLSKQLSLLSYFIKKRYPQVNNNRLLRLD